MSVALWRITAKGAISAVLAATIWLGVSWSSIASAAEDGTPFGNFENAVAEMGGTINIKGWTIDPNTANPIYVWVTVNGVGRHAYANQVRADVGAVYPDSGPSHGFTAALSAPAGSHRVCVTAANVGAGSHRSLGCRTVTVRVGSPFGNFESGVGEDGLLTVKGWTIDPDTTDSIYAWVTIDGVGRHVRADEERRDVGAAFSDYGSEHGFRSTFSARPGMHRVCVTAANVGAGSHASLGCRSVISTPTNQDLRSTDTLSTAWASDRCAAGTMVYRRVLSHNTPVNPRAVDAYAALDRALRATGYTAKSTWAYNCRLIARTDRYSLHSYGIAVDVDPTENPVQYDTTWPLRFSPSPTREGREIDVAEGRSDTVLTPSQVAEVETIRTVDGHMVWAWGGRWDRWSKLDTMHFQVNVTPEELARGLDPATTG